MISQLFKVLIPNFRSTGVFDDLILIRLSPDIIWYFLWAIYLRRLIINSMLFKAGEQIMHLHIVSIFLCEIGRLTLNEIVGKVLLEAL